ncbi:N-terminal Xaa-Pro-Lys N-methyltransferase 1 isoform X2 [Dunckerocampus dactyliophorus]|uniref:N-terminal Xaa-Pro-Lys N-methyltransferase 1 isoform X2 n=1 Tax=Dunckerocampus dactyliophorus TaxID=161453 RepID=UPI0024071BA4|nr:N-terminal Xaa-Pro-Lys N-methyltransferase 1 isoform X2 [Dunckerocampus dactyliophorus]
MGDISGEPSFYSNAEGYWKEVPPTVDGMLGGYGNISSIDINGSKAFLRKFLGEGEGKTTAGCALDCGAGIGRISKRLLLPLFKTVDLVDVTQEFLDKAKTYLGEDGHLTDNHLVEFLRRCHKALRPNGLIVIKDNVSYEGVVPDEVDSSVCRDLEIVRSLVGRAGLSIVYEEQQVNFPKEIYHVHTLALR